MSKCNEEKRDFVGNELKALLMKINNEITEVVYENNNNGEIVKIVFSNDYIRKVNVAGDSLQAIVEDVITRI